MTQVSKRQPASPKQAARRRAAVDRQLDAEFFKALADPTRVKLLACLVKCGRPCSVTEVAACCSVDFSVVARHLTLLARAGLLEASKEGRTVWYTARCSELCDRLRSIVAAIEEWCPGLDPSPAACCDTEGGCP